MAVAKQIITFYYTNFSVLFASPNNRNRQFTKNILPLIKDSAKDRLRGAIVLNLHLFYSVH
jgi:hypothetical protein